MTRWTNLHTGPLSVARSSDDNDPRDAYERHLDAERQHAERYAQMSPAERAAQDAADAAQRAYELEEDDPS